MQARNWCFTLNNYTETEVERIKSIDCVYLVFGRETGENNTPHLQGYIEFKGCVRLQTLKKINERIHWEKRKGTQQQAADYCKKDGVVFEKGNLVIKQQGKRNDLVEIKNKIKNGENMRQIIEICSPNNLKFAEKYLVYNERKRNWKPTITWIYGPTGTGKSKMAHEMFADKDFYRKAKGTKWWDGYDGHEYVIFDDFRDSWMPLTEMLDLCDRYDTMVEYKGGNRQFLAREIIVTSAFHPKDCYKNCGEAIQQLLRRIDNIVHLEAKENVDKNVHNGAWPATQDQAPLCTFGKTVDIIEDYGGSTVALAFATLPSAPASEVMHDASINLKENSLQEAFKYANFLFNDVAKDASKVTGVILGPVTGIKNNELFDNIDSDKFSL